MRKLNWGLCIKVHVYYFATIHVSFAIMTGLHYLP